MADQPAQPRQSAPIPPEDRLIVALDVATPEAALELVRALRPEVRLFKVGLEAFVAGGPSLVERIGAEGGAVFLDLKLLDIPATLAGALRAMEALEPVVLATVHTLDQPAGGALRGPGPHRVRLLGVTVLTSMADAALLGGAADVTQAVLGLTERALALGCDGVIASGREAAALRERFGPDLLVVTPGIRPAAARVADDDQRRAVTPREAILAGADYLVVGRPVRDAADPAAAARVIQAEIRAALAEKAIAPDGSAGA